MKKYPINRLHEVFEQVLGSPDDFMKLERLGSMHSSRLSFTRTLVRRMHHENWKFEIFRNTLDEHGFGCLAYLVQTLQGPVCFVGFACELNDEDRTDRVIAEKWDMCFTLFNGIPTEADFERLSHELPKQEAGRLSESELVMSRANKSVRLFDSVVDSLASGCQPEVESIVKIGYLVRTTAVYGNGKFGLMDYHQVKKSTPFGLPFQAEMFTVYMARQFSFDLVEHVARQRGKSSAVGLSTQLKRALGVGNATGLGMAPFLVGHPKLIAQWIGAWGFTFAIARDRADLSFLEIERFGQLVERFLEHLKQWNTDDPRLSKRLAVLKEEMIAVKEMMSVLKVLESPWNFLSDWSKENASIECQELLKSLILEVYPGHFREYERAMMLEERALINPRMELSVVKHILETQYGWALKINFEDPDSQYYFWYVSQEKEEPRLGRRYSEPGSHLEMDVGIARDVNSLYKTLLNMDYADNTLKVADLLCRYPQYRSIVTRVQSLFGFYVNEIQHNLLDKDCLPIDLLRCKLAIFGATKFDPKSNLWTRITLFQGAPLYEEIDLKTADDWAFPVVPVDDHVD